MTDNSSTAFFDNEVHYPLKKLKCDGNSFHLLDLTQSASLITGNKAWKLKYNIDAWKSSGAEKILTFGGAYSNHIYQTAKLGFHLGIPTIGLIRGEIDDQENPTLKDARRWGMELVQVDRKVYRNRNTPEMLAKLKVQYDAYIIPEGGTNAEAIRGTTELGRMIDGLCEEHHIHHIGLSVGTGGTIAGIINGTNNRTVIGFAALKGDFLTADVKQWVKSPNSGKWIIHSDEEFGGYGKWNHQLIDFIGQFHKETGIMLDPLYTGKMMYTARLKGLLREDHLFIHTGGIQGNRGFNQRYDLNLPTI